MRNTVFALGGAAAIGLLSTGAASAFPVAPLTVTTPAEQVALVCNPWGRCWRSGPRYYRYGYYGPRRYWGPRYGYYGGPYYGGPYYGGPGIAFGGPGFGFRLGL